MTSANTHRKRRFARLAALALAGPLAVAIAVAPSTLATATPSEPGGTLASGSLTW